MNIRGWALTSLAAVWFSFAAIPPVHEGGWPQSAPCPILFKGGVRSIAVAPDGKTIFFPQSHSFLMLSRYRKGGWSRPEIIPFSRDYEQGDPFFSPDGTQLYFWSSRPREGTGEPGLNDLWVAKAAGNGWEAPRCLGIAIKGKPGGSVFPSMTAAGDLYFCSRRASLGQRDLFLAKRDGEGFATPENLGPPVNTAADEFDGTVSPDGNCLVFCRSRRESGSDFYMSRKENGAWTSPRKLGPAVNFGIGASCPAWSPDRRWFYFTSLGGHGHAPGIYRISSESLGLGASGDIRPGAKARRFAPGRISRHGAFGLTFSPDGKTACFAETHRYIMESRLVSGAWTVPQALPFTAQGHNNAPALSPDGSTLFFTSTQPVPGQPLRCELNWGIWAVRKGATGWGKPRRLGNLVDETLDCFVDSPSADVNGTLYFTALKDQAGMNCQIYSAKPSGKGYLGRVVDGSFNLPAKDQAEVAVSPDGNTLVFSSDRPGGAGGYDLYLSRRKLDGTWSPAKNLGPEINTTGNEGSPLVAGDGQTLFFYSGREGKPGIYKALLPL